MTSHYATAPTMRTAASLRSRHPGRPPTTRVTWTVSLMLISCLTPTYNRRIFVPLAVHYFLRQELADGFETELIVVDDGEDCVKDAVMEAAGGDPRVQYHRLENKLSTGEKRNLACDLARGEVMLHWDDDDWYSPKRVQMQVNGLLEARGANVSGLAQAYFFDINSHRGMLWDSVARGYRRRYMLPGEGGHYGAYVMGGSFCYRKSYWEQHQFRPLNVAEDVYWVWRQRPLPAVASVERNAGIASYVVITHANNTSSKRDQVKKPKSSRARDVFLAEHGDMVRAIMGEDIQHYEKLSSWTG